MALSRLPGSRIELREWRRRGGRGDLVLRYAAGDPLGGLNASYVRTTTGTSRDANRVVQTAPTNTARDSDYVLNNATGLYERSLLLEGQRTNTAVQSTDFTNGIWNKTTVTVTPGVADPAGGLNGTTIAATAANGNIFQQVALGAGSDAASLWIRRRNGVGAIKLIDPVGARVVVAVTAAWTRFPAVAVGGATPFVGVELATLGDSVDVWLGDIEAGAFASSSILTTTGAVTRTADVLTVPWAYAPQDMWMYARWNFMGANGTNERILSIGNEGAGATFAMNYASGGGAVQALIKSNGAFFVSNAVGAPAIGDQIEFLAIFSQWKASGILSINRAADVASLASAAAVAQAFSQAQLNFCTSPVASNAFIGLYALKIGLGAAPSSLAVARAA